MRMVDLQYNYNPLRIQTDNSIPTFSLHFIEQDIINLYDNISPRSTWKKCVEGRNEYLKVQQERR